MINHIYGYNIVYHVYKLKIMTIVSQGVLKHSYIKMSIIYLLMKPSAIIDLSINLFKSWQNKTTRRSIEERRFMNQIGSVVRWHLRQRRSWVVN